LRENLQLSVGHVNGGVKGQEINSRVITLLTTGTMEYITLPGKGVAVWFGMRAVR
jgi:hypothetical protein